MKRVVWKNKSNGQLCVTVPRDSSLKEGDIVEVRRSEPITIAYCGIVGDFFHYGHLQLIQFAKSVSDYAVCGVLTDDAVEQYRSRPFANIQERKAVIAGLHAVDRVMLQQSWDPTQNITQLHQEFPNATIILVHGSDWKEIPGSAYINEIGGRVLHHPYYARLSTFKLLSYMQEQKDKHKDVREFTSYIGKEKEQVPPNSSPLAANTTIISSKADTLKALSPLLTKSRIERLSSFTISDWKNHKVSLLSQIQQEFSPRQIVVRSSGVNEDTLDRSNAGCFESVLHVDSSSLPAIEHAVQKVISSYKKKNAESSFNQILIQEQTQDIAMSGVVFTRSLEKNAPYYIISYDDSGSSDAVTSGKHHQVLALSHFAANIPSHISPLLEAVKEIEQLVVGIPLDIEFAITKMNDIVIFQVRPLAANMRKEQQDHLLKEKKSELKQKFNRLASPQSHLAGDTTFFADMPDWNPAEIIGDNPHHLDYSLYDYLITNSAWHEARASQGYYDVNPAKLVELFGNKPYVNVRNTFNSFTPASLSPQLRSKLVSFYLEKLRRNPHLQDKVEFQVVYTCYDFSFSEKSDERKKELSLAGFSTAQIQEIRASLLNLTNLLITNSIQDIQHDLQTVFSMEEIRSKELQKVSSTSTPQELLASAQLLLRECRSKGTIQFSRLARLGFIGKIILKSLVQTKVISQDWYDDFYISISTVATQQSDDFRKLLVQKMTKNEFLHKYYHLRPGTYDITSLRYDANPSLLSISTAADIAPLEKISFALDTETEQKITRELHQAGFTFLAPFFLEFVRQATEARELSKFEFTKNLSDALELIAKAGEQMGFTRKELAHLNIDDIFLHASSATSDITRFWKEQIQQQEKERSIHEQLILPAILFSENDIDVVEHYQARPNFITQKAIEQSVVFLDKATDHNNIPTIEGSIVVLENGDPGYDWIFTRNLAGLITKYGGVGSHMSIRCAEFGIPAAIGCGDILFEQIKNADTLLLDCRAQKIMPFKKDFRNGGANKLTPVITNYTPTLNLNPTTNPIPNPSLHSTAIPNSIPNPALNNIPNYLNNSVIRGTQ